jgi:hypothetical protein
MSAWTCVDYRMKHARYWKIREELTEELGEEEARRVAVRAMQGRYGDW